MQTGRNEAFTISKEELSEWNLAKGTYFFRAANSDIQRYHLLPSAEVLIYPEGYAQFEDLPAQVKSRLKASEVALKERAGLHPR